MTSYREGYEQFLAEQWAVPKEADGHEPPVPEAVPRQSPSGAKSERKAANGAAAAAAGPSYTKAVDPVDRVDRRGYFEANGAVSSVDRTVDRVDRRTRWTADELLHATFPEPKWAVPGVLAQGVSLLCGVPKGGKSWMCFHIALAVANGGRAFSSIDVAGGDVLYAALEDTDQRLQGRLKRLLSNEPAPRRLSIWTEMPRVTEGGLEELREWLTQHDQARLIVTDTLARVRPLRRRSGDIYAEDYEVVASLKRVADEFRVALVVVHHTRKMTAEDMQDMISGTNGLAGAADTTLVLARQSGSHTLYGRGRDVEEIDYGMEFDPATCLWSIKGQAERLSAERQEICRTILATGGGRKPAEVAAVLEKNPSTIKNLMWKMATDGILLNLGNGAYEVMPEYATSLPGAGRSTGSTGNGESVDRRQEAVSGTDNPPRSTQSTGSTGCQSEEEIDE